MMRSLFEAVLSSLAVAVITSIIGYLGFSFKEMFASFPSECIFLGICMIAGGTGIWFLGQRSLFDKIQRIKKENHDLKNDNKILSKQLANLQEVDDRTKTARAIAVSNDMEASWPPNAK